MLFNEPDFSDSDTDDEPIPVYLTIEYFLSRTSYVLFGMSFLSVTLFLCSSVLYLSEKVTGGEGKENGDEKEKERKKKRFFFFFFSLSFLFSFLSFLSFLFFPFFSFLFFRLFLDYGGVFGWFLRFLKRMLLAQPSILL